MYFVARWWCVLERFEVAGGGVVEVVYLALCDSESLGYH